MRRVQVTDGVELAVQDLGDGPAVLFVPGFGLDHGVWDRQVRVFSASHRTLAVDPRGHGASDAPRQGYHLDGLADDLAVVLEASGERAATVVGHSLGGQVALRLATQRPDLVAALVLVASNGVRTSRSEHYPFGRPAEPALTSLIEAEAHDRLGSRRRGLACFAVPPPEATLDWLFAMSMRMPSWAAVECYRTLLCSDQIEALDAVSAPVLQVMGRDDPVQSLRGARWLAERLRHSRLVELPDCGHYPMLEQADGFDEALALFLGESRDGGRRGADPEMHIVERRGSE